MRRPFFGNMTKKSRPDPVWEPKIYRETNKFLANAVRGFYNINCIFVSDSAPVEEWVFDSILSGETPEMLEMLQIHIGSYRGGEISPFGMEQIEKIFDAYARRPRRVDLIVRILYDWDGKGYESDPASMSVIFRHMDQIGTVFEKYRDLLFIVQGVFVGSWAEMHSSRYLIPDSFQKLIGRMRKIVPKTAYLAVRTPAFWRMAARRSEPLTEREARNGEDLAARLCLFNDGIAGNDTDCGTYGVCSRKEAVGPGESWIREEELQFQEQLNLFVPNGGEAVIENRENDFENAVRLFSRMRLTYLNKGYDPNVLDKWIHTAVRSEDPVWDGISGFDYIERHLGYRFVVRSSFLRETGGHRGERLLTLEIENVGFAPIYRPCRVEIFSIPLNEDGENAFDPAGSKPERLPVDTDVRGWIPGKRIRLDIPAAGFLGEDSAVYLRVTDERGMPVFFANEAIVSADGRCLLGIARERK